ncbi:MAG: type I-E CRISPR-associated protein Cas6/Cse3/CasE [Clostridiales Family XIII bacterium]|jgi:CRISPR system Cascade subunit CasE|nr:type I-E CRISPR-associated protein Cas6/Cse3/CasE [Clostridiales Family XIII bacterium]
MYLSRVEINQRKRETLRALASPQILHAAIEACFSSEETVKYRNLWRIDKLNNSLYLILQSEIKPDFTHIIEQFGWIEQKWETKTYDEFMSRLQNGQVWMFRLQANPAHSKNIEKGSRGKVFGHVTIDSQRKWLADRAAKCGFEIVQTPDGNLNFDVAQCETRKFWRQGEMVTLETAVFEGALRIIDEESLLHAMRNGIGRAKAYGCGLLTLARQSDG